MIDIKEVNGRYEVLSPGRHWEVFESKLDAHAAALGLAAEVEQETGSMPLIAAPWALWPSTQLLDASSLSSPPTRLSRGTGCSAS